MKEKSITCRINLGIMYQTIYVKESNDNIIKHQILIENLPEFLFSINDINDIYISGVPKAFAESIERKTKQLQIEQYNKSTKQFHYI